jgi:hypothetical protein
MGPQRATLRQRILSLLGCLVSVALILLGAYPGIYTIVAIPVIPAPIIFAVGILRPNFLSRRPSLRAYLTICVIASALCWVFELWWLLRD